MKHFSFLFCLLFSFIASFNAFGSQIDVKFSGLETSPLSSATSNYKPVLNEQFLMSIIVEYESDDIPGTPSFEAPDFQIYKTLTPAHKFQTSNRGVKKQIVYPYILVPLKEGSSSIKNIVVNVDGKDRRSGSKYLTVLKSRPAPLDIFLQAEVDMEKIYVGQGFTINYYLYYNPRKVAVDGAISAKDPTFKNLIKRFILLRQNEPTENVDYDGTMFRRSKVYSVRAFAENPGQVDIGPMSIEISYRTSNFGPSRNRKLISKRQKLEITSLPGPIPDNYSGLVGDHKFELTAAKNKFLVNEPIEFSARVTGQGALEKFSLPQIVDDPNVESFDVQSEMELNADQINGSKKFNMTYLARAPITIPEKKVSFVIFNPDTVQYEVRDITVPSIVVGGTAAKDSEAPVEEASPETSEVKKVLTAAGKDKIVNSVVAPDFKKHPISKNYWIIANIVLAFGLIVLVVRSWISRPKTYRIDPSLVKVIGEMKRNGLTYSGLHKLVINLDLDGAVSKNAITIINESALSKSTKEYFINALNECERANFSNDRVVKVKFVSSHFKKLLDAIKK